MINLYLQSNIERFQMFFCREFLLYSFTFFIISNNPESVFDTALLFTVKRRKQWDSGGTERSKQAHFDLQDTLAKCVVVS